MPKLSAREPFIHEIEIDVSAAALGQAKRCHCQRALATIAFIGGFARHFEFLLDVADDFLNLRH